MYKFFLIIIITKNFLIKDFLNKFIYKLKTQINNPTSNRNKLNSTQLLFFFLLLATQLDITNVHAHTLEENKESKYYCRNIMEHNNKTKRDQRHSSTL